MADDLGCPDCSVKPSEPHELGCDVARCPACGIQRLQCDAHADDQSLDALAVWTGVWPGTVECGREGWWCVWTSKGWIACPPDTRDAFPDLNRLLIAALAKREFRWSRDLQQWIRPEELTRG